MRSKNNRGRGFSLLEVGLGIGITALAITSLLHVSTDSSNAIKASAAADQLVQVQQAAQLYVNENFNSPTLANNPSVTLQVSDLVTAGFLPTGFTSTNVYGQTLQVMLTRGTQPIPGTANTMPVENGLVVATGGTTVDDKNLGRIMSRIGAGGGAVLSDPPPGVAAGTVQGYGGGWSVPASDYTGLTAGHAVATLSFGANSTQFGDQLYRNNIGFPEAQTLHAPVNLNGNNLDDINALRFGTGSSSSCQEPTAGQSEENLFGVSGNPCLIFDGGTNWMTANGNGVSNGLLVGQSAGNGSSIAGQSVGVAPDGVTFFNGPSSLPASVLGALSMNTSPGNNGLNTIYTTQNAATSGGVNIDTAGGSLSTYGSGGTTGNVTTSNVYARHGTERVNDFETPGLVI